MFYHIPWQCVENISLSRCIYRYGRPRRKERPRPSCPAAFCRHLWPVHAGRSESVVAHPAVWLVRPIGPHAASSLQPHHPRAKQVLHVPVPHSVHAEPVTRRSAAAAPASPRSLDRKRAWCRVVRRLVAASRVSRSFTVPRSGAGARWSATAGRCQTEPAVPVARQSDASESGSPPLSAVHSWGPGGRSSAVAAPQRAHPSSRVVRSWRILRRVEPGYWCCVFVSLSPFGQLGLVNGSDFPNLCIMHMHVCR